MTQKGKARYTPQEDITAYEVALCIRLLIDDIVNNVYTFETFFEDVANYGLERHFTKEFPNGNG